MFSRFQRPWTRLWLTCLSRSDNCRSKRSSPKRGRCLSTARISPSNRGASFGRCDWHRWVLRGGSSTQHDRRSETFWGSKWQCTSAIVCRGRSGLPVSLRGFLQNPRVVILLGHQLLRLDILFPRGFELLRHFRLSAVSGQKSVPRSQPDCKLPITFFPWPSSASTRRNLEMIWSTL